MSWAEDEGYDAYDGADYLGLMTFKMSPKEQRQSQEWHTKDGRCLKVVDMDDLHLYNAYMHTGAEFLFKEMVYRLFDERTAIL